VLQHAALAGFPCWSVDPVASGIPLVQDVCVKSEEFLPALLQRLQA
jgi:hypothetical protein